MWFYSSFQKSYIATFASRCYFLTYQLADFTSSTSIQTDAKQVKAKVDIQSFTHVNFVQYFV